MKRLFWVTLGATAGVLIVKQLRQSAQQLTPSSLASALAEQAREFWSDVRAGMSEREPELRAMFGLDPPSATEAIHFPDTGPVTRPDEEPLLPAGEPLLPAGEPVRPSDSGPVHLPDSPLSKLRGVADRGPTERA